MKILPIAITVFLSFFAPDGFYDRLSEAAIGLTKTKVTYDGSYFAIPYPNGDVPANKGVCTDVVVRAYRKMGIDVQKEVHLDMTAHFGLYPKIWGLRRPDRNIDHRRVPNLQVFFTRFGKKLATTANPADYKPGDLVTWMVDGKLPHIGIVTHKKSARGTPLVVHNIGAGQVLEDCLFKYPMTGHYRFGS
ncbi:DUF1287 domain-containing protein [Flavobacterium caeni]|uniref:DUF1287 domain-containing protein n=1 Tax=Flavobacterium caeni TaxID=490189 RepID=A0A1G5F7N3_9FLAO|nr:DUF1287 domain-containing protein [Flavobacterium caeni]SCY35174.1 hypothetical protein SAMN02927903_01200 [Flavobacterium caeni]